MIMQLLRLGGFVPAEMAERDSSSGVTSVGTPFSDPLRATVAVRLASSNASTARYCDESDEDVAA